MALDYFTVTRTGIQLATSIASNGAAIPLNSAGEVPRLIRIAASQPACIRIGSGVQTAVTTDLQVQPGDAVVITTNGCTNIAAIQVSAAGVVQVSPLENNG